MSGKEEEKNFGQLLLGKNTLVEKGKFIAFLFVEIFLKS